MRRILIVFVFVCIAMPAIPVFAQEHIDPESFLGRRYKIVLNRIMPRITACYEKAAAKDTKLEGSIKVKVSVKTEGGAKSVEVLENNLPNEEAVSCMQGVLSDASWPSGEKEVYFNYTFFFERTEPEEEKKE